MIVIPRRLISIVAIDPISAVHSERSNLRGNEPVVVEPRQSKDLPVLKVPIRQFTRSSFLSVVS